MARGESPFQGRYQVPQVDFRPYMQGMSDLGAGLRQAGVAAGQTMAAWGEQKKQNQADIKIASNMAGNLRRLKEQDPDPNKANFYDSSIISLEDDTLSPGARAQIAKGLESQMTLTAQQQASHRAFKSGQDEAYTRIVTNMTSKELNAALNDLQNNPDSQHRPYAGKIETLVAARMVQQEEQRRKNEKHLADMAKLKAETEELKSGKSKVTVTQKLAAFEAEMETYETPQWPYRDTDYLSGDDDYMFTTKDLSGLSSEFESLDPDELKELQSDDDDASKGYDVTWTDEDGDSHDLENFKPLFLLKDAPRGSPDREKYEAIIKYRDLKESITTISQSLQPVEVRLSRLNTELLEAHDKLQELINALGTDVPVVEEQKTRIEMIKKAITDLGGVPVSTLPSVDRLPRRTMGPPEDPQD